MSWSRARTGRLARVLAGPRAGVRRAATAALVMGAAVLASAATLGCRGSTPDERDKQRPSPEPNPSSERPTDADQRKRECVARLTATADPELHALLRSACAEWVALDIPGLALAVVDADGRVFSAELGVRCFADPTPVTPRTGFRIGSVSKPVTAALALGLVADGSLALDSPATIVPGFTTPAALPVPELGPLLRHRSGLGEIEPATLVELDGAWLPALARSEAAGPVGEFDYSNAGYSVIGAMLEAAAEQPFPALVRARIAAPLGLTRLSTDTRDPELACGHLAEDPDRHPIAVADDLAFMPGDPAWMAPAGGVLASASDLARFAVAIGTPRLPGSEAMLEPGELLPAARAQPTHPDERYGYGLRSWAAGEGRIYAHTGNNVSFLAELRVRPGTRAVVILANSGVELPATVAAAEALLTAPN